MNNMASLPIFVTVVECGSFSLASKQLNLTKSAVSKRISQLEDVLAIRLFNRTTRKLSLTEAGHLYYDYAVQSLHLAQQGLDAVSELQGTPQGKLKITAPMSFGCLHIAPLISEFLANYPGIDIDLQLEDAMVDLVEHGFDLGVRIGELSLSNLIAKRLTTCKSVLCCSPSYFQQYGSPTKPSDLVAHNCIRYAYFRGGVEWTFFHNGQKVKVLPKGNVVVNNSEAIRQLLLGGSGIAQLPTFIAARDIKKGILMSLMDDYSLPEHAIYAVYPERKHLPLKVRVFIDFLSEKFGHSTPYWDEY
ncbi:LysR family transcriptional regulator [Vibrio sagamiensis]|uniref:Transcriptional regulator n=1 Tax=Vibrio sagamiensis NBRC 104589 TaxID=1219064 RepID=A0A511QDU7_9VIBR|nr:LysR family transcriptional regulator [Vibrio sagamiensis]PNQ65698.1 LysR family transcriptional regulator [Vibrio agarivorans]GEM75356.1 transcriptional regulator [Vibrio sagamiensis NBRC 104589]